MAENTEPSTVEVDAPVDVDVDPQEGHDEPFDKDRALAKIAKVNSEAANLRSRLKEAEEKAQLYDELENAKKSEAERMAERLASAEAKAQEAERRAMVAEVTRDTGLPAALAKRLTGTTREELEADAAELLSLMPADEERPTVPSRRPTESLRPGATPDGAPLNSDPLLRDLKNKLGIT